MERRLSCRCRSWRWRAAWERCGLNANQKTSVCEGSVIGAESTVAPDEKAGADRICDRWNPMLLRRGNGFYWLTKALLDCRCHMEGGYMWNSF